MGRDDHGAQKSRLAQSDRIERFDGGRYCGGAIVRFFCGDCRLFLASSGEVVYEFSCFLMMSGDSTVSGFRWYAVQTLSNSESKVKAYMDKFIAVEGMDEYIKEVLVPTETVVEVRSGQKYNRLRKFYPGYLFLYMRLYDEEGKVFQKPWYFVREVDGVIAFLGGEHPTPLKKEEMEEVLMQMRESEGKAVPKVKYGEGEEVKITDGPFMNLTGCIDEVDVDKGTLKVSVSIFGRFTPVELEYWQVERA